jgi:hypothetical protein
MSGSDIRLDECLLDVDDKPKAEEPEIIKSNVEALEIYSDRHPFSLPLRRRNFENEAEYKKFVKNCEMMIRRSVEYKEWRNYIVDVLQYNECTITHERMDEVTVEVHHHIPSLFTLVSALVNKCLEENTDFCSYDICIKAIEIHFQNRIGFVTLLKSLHEKFHNGYLGIPIECVKGDYSKFLRDYTKYLDETENDKIQARLAVNTTNCSWTKDNYQDVAEG